MLLDVGQMGNPGDDRHSLKRPSWKCAHKPHPQINMRISAYPKLPTRSAASVGLVRRLRPDFVYYQFQKLIGESGVRRIGLHGLMHIAARFQASN